MPRPASARRYAQAVFQLAVEFDELERWLDDLTILADSVISSQFLDFMSQPRVPTAAKLEVIRESLGDSVGRLAVNLISLLATRNIADILPEIADQYRELLDSHQGIERAEVVSAVPLTDSQHHRAVDVLEGLSGHEVRLSTRVDPALLGGIIMRIGDRVVDGSTRSKLQAMRRELSERR
jgi:F-type H+-transporting ATPase subunit delta